MAGGFRGELHRPKGSGGTEVKRDAIRALVADHLAGLGYPKSWYAWSRPGRLEVFDGEATEELHIPAGSRMTKAEVLRRLERVLRVGSAVPAPAPMHRNWVPPVQLDIVSALVLHTHGA